jgi:glycosyltransferase involved in cell wall biosynthesis
VKLVIYTDALGIGGAEISLKHLTTHVSEAIALTVIGVSPQVVNTLTSQRSEVLQRVLPAQGSRGFLAHFRTLYQLNPDIIHFNLCTPWTCAMGLTAALALPKARVVRVDQLPLRTTDAIALWRTRALSLRVDTHIAVGQGAAKHMEDFYALGRHTVLSVPNGVPDIKVNTIPFLPRTNGQLVVGSVGRLDAMKGHDILLRAIAQLNGVRGVILGEGQQRPALEQLAIDLGIRDRIDLLGWVDEPRSYLPAFDIVAFPSRSEGFPLAIVEAMLAARPVVATRVGSVAEAVMVGETGLLVEKDDVTGLTSALRRLVDNPALRDRLGQRGREVAVAQFTAQQMAQRYEQIWQTVLAAPQVPRLRVPRPRD